MAASSTPRPGSLSDRAAPDADLIARIRGGARRPFAVLVRRYNQRMFRIVRAVLRDDQEAEDVVQQAFVTAYDRLSQFRGDGSFGAWLTKIAVHEAYSRQRAAGRRGDLALVAARRDRGSSPTPEDAVERSQVAGILEAHVDAMPESMRLVFVMRDVEELTTAETAASLGISEAAVRVRLHRARNLLQGQLARALELAPDMFTFAGARCDRITSGVLATLCLGRDTPSGSESDV